MQTDVEHVKAIIKELRSSVEEKTVKKLDLDKSERIADRLASFSDECQECQEQLLELKSYYMKLQEGTQELTVKEHNKFINEISNHLQKRHKLVADGTYLAIYLSLGVSFGMMLGLTLFDNVGLGMSIGMSMGLALGIGLDTDAKKKGKTI